MKTTDRLKQIKEIWDQLPDRLIPKGWSHRQAAQAAFAFAAFFYAMVSSVSGIASLLELGKYWWFVIVVLWLLAFFLFAIICLFSRDRLRLDRPWQALAWTHYRTELSRLASRTKGAGRFDFVTFSGARFEPMLKGGAATELAYVLGSHSSLDLLLFDIEWLGELQRGVRTSQRGPNAKACLVPLETFCKDEARIYRALGQRTLPKIEGAVRSGNSTLVCPLRWGITGVVVRLNSSTIEEVKRENPAFDLGSTFNIAWLTEDCSALRKVLLKKRCVVALDWYLPTMQLLASCALPNWPSAKEAELKPVADMLDRLGLVMAPNVPLITDPLELTELVNKSEELVVLGGGNWLLRNDEPNPPDQLRCMPFCYQTDRNSADKPRLMLWCECLGFLSDKSLPDEADWRHDAERLLQWFLEHRANMLTSARLGSFSIGTENREGKVQSSWRELADKYGEIRRRPDFPMEWEAVWSKWKKTLTQP